MTISPLDIKNSLDKAFRLLKPKRKDLDDFKRHFNTLISHINEQETEEHVKIHLMDFLKATYHPEHLVATNGRTDFVIHTGANAQTPVGVMFEVKRPASKHEMISRTNLNAKAMHEIILYFLEERFDKKNISLTNLVITSIYEWFVFDATIFERIFTQNKQLENAYQAWKNKQRVSTSTSLFYDEIVKPFLAELDKEISFTYFDIRDYEKNLKRTDDKNDTKLIALHKFFTPTHLLKLSFANDSNSLDKGFFAELLHIIGLEEVKDGSKKIIRRLPVERRNQGAIIENALNILEVENVLRKVPTKLLFGQNEEDKLFNLALDLSITWVNRLLFLKLLEAQLLKYHQGDKKYRFLNVQTIKDYDELYKLFFQVLARRNADRLPAIKEKYGIVPYLNSSLFEISELEDLTIKINALDDNLDIPFYANSVLKKGISKKDASVINTLHYFFNFLDAYDFSSVGKEEIQEDNKTIINASVLGLVFEKINGYRDGSIYTPGAITMYMCREVIRKAVVKRFNDQYQWNCESINDLKNHLADRRNAKDLLEFNDVIDNLRLADPAVGSGHFLVSSLNELISIKAELGIFADEKGNRLSDIEISIANDELVVNYANQDQDFFEYLVSTKNDKISVSPQIQRIQKTLFNEKRKLIENCLFGVDINPNSVKICQLRLWIELLKNAYYKVDNQDSEIELETLPNIDINIKQGNSLLSKYSLKEDLSDVFKKDKYGIKEYQQAVQRYKEAPNKEAKEELRIFFKDIKAKFHETVSNRDPRRKKLADWRGKKINAETTNNDLFGQKKSKKDVEVEVAKYQKEIDKLSKEIADIENNQLYKNAFEWRFEFPEVLDNNGDFVGFDAIIGNPPYIQLQKMGAEADILQKQDYITFVRTGDIYSLFYELGIRLLKPDYYLGYITSNKWMRAGYGQSTRKFFLEHTNPLLLIDFGGYQVFDNATVDVNIFIAQKSPYNNDTQTCLIGKSLASLEKLSDFILLNQNIYTFTNDESWVILDAIEQSIKAKIEALGTPLKEWNINIYRGVLTGYNNAFIIDGAKKEELIRADSKSAEIIRPILRGRDVKRYSHEFAGLYIITTFPSLKINIDNYPAIKQHLMSFSYDRLKQTGDIGARKKTNNKWFETQDSISYWDDFSKQKIIYPEITKFLNFYKDNGVYVTNNKCFILSGENLSFLEAFLNSSLFKYCFTNNFPELLGGTRELRKIFLEQIPIIKVDFQIDIKFEAITNQLKNLKINNQQTTQIERKIDSMIFDLYNLNKEERNQIGFIQII